MAEVLDRPRIATNQIELVLAGGDLSQRRGMDCEQAGRFLISLAKLYSEFCEKVPFSAAHPEAAEYAKTKFKDDVDFPVSASQLSLVGAQAGSMSFLLEAVLVVQASLVGPLPTAIANFMGVLDALRGLGSLLPGALKRWDRRLTDRDERELSTLANAISDIAKIAATVETITITTSGGHSVVIKGAAFKKLAG